MNGSGREGDEDEDEDGGSFDPDDYHPGEFNIHGMHSRQYGVEG